MFWQGVATEKVMCYTWDSYKCNARVKTDSNIPNKGRQGYTSKTTDIAEDITCKCKIRCHTFINEERKRKSGIISTLW